MANGSSGKADPVLDLPLVDLEPLRFPPQPVRSPGALVANTAIRRKDQAEDEGEDPNPLIDFVAEAPPATRVQLGSVTDEGRRPLRCHAISSSGNPPSRAEPSFGRGSVDRGLS